MHPESCARLEVESISVNTRVEATPGPHAAHGILNTARQTEKFLQRFMQDEENQK